MSETTPAAPAGSEGGTPPPAEAEAKTAEKSPTAEDVAKLRKALDSEREARRNADKRVKDLEPYEVRAREAEEASKTEQQRVADRLAAAEAKAAEADQRASAAIEAANRRLVAAEARALAAAASFRNPEHAVRLLDLSDVTIGEDGSLDAAAITSKLTALAETDAYLVSDGRAVPKPVLTQGRGSGKGSDADIEPGLARLRDAYSHSK